MSRSHSHPPRAGHVHAHEHGPAHFAHAHKDGSGHAVSRTGEARRLWLVLLIALAAVLAEGIGGLLSGSLALLSDAGHVLADSAAIALALFALRVSSRPADARRTYGYYRLEILAALLNGASLIAIAGFIALEAVARLRHPAPVQVALVVQMSLVGIALNGAGMWLTHSGEGASMNLRGTFLHLAGDLINSVGVLVSAGLI